MTIHNPDFDAGERQLNEKKPASEKLAREQGSRTSNSGGSPESMRSPYRLARPDRQEAQETNNQKRTVGNHPADPNRQGADWNLLPPGITDEDVRDPGGMEDREKSD